MKFKTLLILVALFFFPSLGSAAEVYTLEKIQKVLSGDTFLLQSGKRIRLIGIDAPENEPNKKAKEDSLRTGQTLEDIVRTGTEAAEWVRSNLEGKNIFLKYDQKRSDDHGAEWVYAYLYDVSKFYEAVERLEEMADVKFDWWQPPKPGKFIFLNATILRAGYATVVKDAPNLKYADVLETAYQEAKRDYEGLWNVDYYGAPCAKEGEKITDCAGCVIKCCKGLEPMFSLVIDGRCQELPAPGAIGYCSNCDNNICEPEHLEDDCTCPKDCL